MTSSADGSALGVQRAHELLLQARERAAPHVSDYRVGAVVVGQRADGEREACLGANLELRGLPLALTVHAEQAALHRAALSGVACLSELYVTAAPCGHCRQFMFELAEHSRPRLCVLEEGNVTESMELAELLPSPFDATDLGSKPEWFASESPRTDLLQQSWPNLQEAAEAALQRSHAPYTGNRVGVALRWADGSVDVGARVESVAFNPSLWAFLGALSTAAMRGQEPDLAALRELCLVEVVAAAAEGPLVQALLQNRAPQVQVEMIERLAT